MTAIEQVTRFHFRGANRDAVNSQAKEVLNEGPRGTGKSVANLYKCVIKCERRPGTRGLIMRKTRASLTDSAMVTLEKHVFPPDHPCIAGARRSNRHSYVFPNGSELVLGGMGSTDEAKKVLSTEWDFIYVNEVTELREEEWEQLIPTLRNNKFSYHQLIGDCNPEGPNHWVLSRCNRGILERHTSRHRDNPWLWDEYANQWTKTGADYMDTLNRLTGIRRERYLLGKWVQAEGVVYEDWDARIHLIDRFEPPREWRRYRAIDFGYTNPFVCLWAAVDNDGRVYVYRHIYRSKRLVEDHAKDILRLSCGEVITQTTADHDAEGRATLERYGIPTVAAKKDILTGIEIVAKALRPAGDGKPRLFIMRDSLVSRDEALDDAKLPWAIEQEFDGYVLPNKKPDHNVKELPVDENNHGMDALRYLMMHLNYSGSPSVARSDRKRLSAGMRGW